MNSCSFHSTEIWIHFNAYKRDSTMHCLPSCRIFFGRSANFLFNCKHKSTNHIHLDKNIRISLWDVSRIFDQIQFWDQDRRYTILTYPSEYQLIQLKFEINIMKITENGTNAYSKICVSKFLIRNATVEEVWDFYHYIDSSETESSGWSNKGVIHSKFALQRIHMQ